MDCDLGYIHIIHNEVNLHYNFDHKYKHFNQFINNNNNNNCNESLLKFNNNLIQFKDQEIHKKSNDFQIKQKDNYNKVINNNSVYNSVGKQCGKQLIYDNNLSNIISINSDFKLNQTLINTNNLNRVKTDVNQLNNNNINNNNNNNNSVDNKVDNNCKTMNNHNIYRGLYPIKEVKQYYKREFLKGKPLYICLWNNCGFKTWKYSQHIARHIHLKHIGIKELKCEEPNCEKTFKRPESLVQHQKNHLCGFGIDSIKMKDPLNVCGVKNIKKYYFRELDNDYYVFGCKWNDCQFVTNNSGSIRRHVHNQHLCPHSCNNNKNNINKNNNNNNKNTINNNNVSVNNSHCGSSYEHNNSFNSLETNSNDISMNNSNNADYNLPLIEIIELDEAFSPGLNDNNEETIVAQTIDNPFAISANPIPMNHEMESNLNRRSSGGLYSLKNYSQLYRKVNIEGEIYFKCNCNQFTTKSQISLVRHIWSDIGRNVFECDIEGCDAQFDNEFNLYKHKKFDHNCDQSCSSSQSFIAVEKSPQLIDERIDNYSYCEDNNNVIDKNNEMVINEDLNDDNNEDFLGTTRRPSSGIYSLKNFSQHFKKLRVDDQVFYKCECGNFTTKSSVSLIRHIWVHKGINCFECDLCNAKFDNESSLYRHRKFDHNCKNMHNFTNNLINSNNFPNNDNLAFNNICDERQSMMNNESIPIVDVNQETNNSFVAQTQPNILKSYSPDRTAWGSGPYSLKHYGKYYQKLKIGEEFCYKCTVCGFNCRSQVSLIRHIWNHTGMNRFECDYVECEAKFNTESELYKHKKIHNIKTPPQKVITSTPKSTNSNEISANYLILNNDNFNEEQNYSLINTESLETINNSIDANNASTSSHLISKYNAKPGLYSLKAYSNYFKKVKLLDGINYICNCGEFTTRSQVSLVRHILLHKSSKESLRSKVSSIADQSEDVRNSSIASTFELKAVNESIPDINANESFNGLANESFNGLANESFNGLVNESFISTNSHSRRNLTFKKYKFKSSTSEENLQQMQSTGDKSTEEPYFDDLIVEIEDRGFFCQWNECDFSDNDREVVLQHIKQNHIKNQNNSNGFMQRESHNNNFDAYDDNQRNGNASHLSLTSDDMIIRPEQSSSQFVSSNKQNFEQLIDKELRNSTLMYLCKAPNCFFETALKPSIVNHIRKHHIIDNPLNESQKMKDIISRTARTYNHFKCKFNYCNASFPSYEYLVEHQKIHSNEMALKAKQLSTTLDNPPEKSTNFDHSIDRSDTSTEEVDSECNTRSPNKFKEDSFKSLKSYSYCGELGIKNADKYSEIVWESDDICVNICKWNNCGYKSYVRGNMIRHIRKHTGDKPFICNINNCGQTFAYSTDAKIHQRRYH